MNISIGSTGITTTALVLGCARIGSALTPLNRRGCMALIDEAFELGVRHFDTSSIYGQGDSERYLGEALARRRGQVCLSSKAGQRPSPRQALLAHLKAPIRLLAARRGDVREKVAAQRSRGVPRCFAPDYIESSLRASLQRLRIDALDVFYLHSPDSAVLDDPALIERVVRLRERGLFRAFGVSCDEGDVAWAAARCEEVQVVQFGLGEGAADQALLAELQRRGKSAVLRGLMLGQAAVAAPTDPLVARIARTLALPAFGGLIIGTTNAAHLRQNVAAFREATRAPRALA